MPFGFRNLSRLAYAQGFTLWHYKGGGDRLSDILRPNYFLDAAGMLHGGDMMMVTAVDGGAIALVTASNKDAVTVAVMGS